MFLGHNLGVVLSSCHDARKRGLKASDSSNESENDADALGFRALIVNLLVVAGLLAATILMISIFVGTFTHYY